MAERKLKTFAMSWETLKESITVIMSTVFMPLIQTLTPIVAKIRDFIIGVNDLTQSTSPLGEAFGLILRSIGRILEFMGSYVGITLAVAGAHRIMGVALAWAGIKMGELGFNSFRAVWGLQAVKMTARGIATAFREAAMGATGLSWAIKGVAGAASFMWKALAGPIMWIIQAVWLLVDLWNLIFDKGSKQLPAQKDLTSAMDAQAKAITEQADISRDLAKSTQSLSSTVDKWKALQEAKLPRPSSKAIAEATSRINVLDESGRFASASFKKTVEAMNLIRAVDEERRKALVEGIGEFPTQERFKAAAEAAQGIIPLLSAFFPDDEKIIRAVTATGKMFEEASKGPTELVGAAKGAGYLAGSTGVIEVTKLEHELARVKADQVEAFTTRRRLENILASRAAAKERGFLPTPAEADETKKLQASYTAALAREAQLATLEEALPKLLQSKIAEVASLYRNEPLTFSGLYKTMAPQLISRAQTPDVFPMREPRSLHIEPEAMRMPRLALQEEHDAAWRREQMAIELIKAGKQPIVAYIQTAEGVVTGEGTARRQQSSSYLPGRP